MRQLTPLLVAVALAVAAHAGRAQQPSAAAAAAFTRVTLIDVVAGTTRPDMTVLGGGGRIGAIGRTGEVRVPDGAREIDGAGKFLIPGLWDMHVHDLRSSGRTFTADLTLRGV
jgi:imidazolonepropionase-like amidohydrolase